MYKIISGALVLLIICELFLMGKDRTPSPIGQHKEVNDEADDYPGWYQQWFAMKKNQDGAIPDNVMNKIMHEQKLNNDRSSNLFSIWEMGPNNVGGRTRSLLIDQTNHNRFLAGSVSGGLWESLNKGGNWHPVDDFAPNLSVSSTAQDHFNTNTFYYSTGEVTGNTENIPGAGVFKSTDGGHTFSQLAATANSNFNYIWRVRTSTIHADELYVGTADHGLYKSYDAGSTFHRVYVNGARDIAEILVFPDGGVMITVSAAGIFYSSTGDSATFTKLTNDIPQTGFNRVEIAYCKTHPDVVYAVYEKSTLDGVKSFWRSDDRGQNWYIEGNPQTQGITFTYPWYCFTLAVSPTQPNIVIVGGVDIAISTSSGALWAPMQYAHSDYHYTLFDEDDPTTFYITSDGGIYKYNTANATYYTENKNTGYNVTQFYAGTFAPGGFNAFGGAQDNGTQASRNNNPSFDHIGGGDGAFTQISQQDPDLSFVSSQYAEIAKATNSSDQFPLYHPCLNQMDSDNDGNVDDPMWFINPFEMNQADGSQLFLPTLKRIWHTSDGGDNWSPLTQWHSLTGGDLYALGVSNEQIPTLYIGGAGMSFGRVNNANSGFGNEVDLRNSVPDSLLTSFIANITVDPVDNSIIYVSLSDYSTKPRAWKVINAKTSSPDWINISGDLPSDLPVNWIEVDPLNPETFFMAATDFGLYTSKNGGVNWTLESQIPKVPIMNLRLRNSDGQLFIFTHGRGLWTANIYHTNNVGVPETAMADLNIYPNPVHDYLHIETSAGSSLVEIFNMQGAMIMTKTISGNSDLLDFSRQPSGVYIVQVTGNGKTSVAKIVKD